MARQLHVENETFEIAETDLVGLSQPDPEVFYTLRPLTTQKFRELDAKNTKPQPNKRTGGMDLVRDDNAREDDIIDFIVKDWRGITANGQAAECTRDNKIKGMDPQIKTALINAAGTNRRTQAEKDSSFRGSEGVL
jgi:hypothetical protein